MSLKVYPFGESVALEKDLNPVFYIPVDVCAFVVQNDKVYIFDNSDRSIQEFDIIEKIQDQTGTQIGTNVQDVVKYLNEFIFIAGGVSFPILGELNDAENVGTGSEVFKQKDDETLQFRTLTAGNQVNLIQSLDEIQINLNFNVFVIVETASDLPLILAANTTYLINGEITTSQQITVTNDNSAILGFNRDKDALIYTGTGDFITIIDVNFSIQGIRLTAGSTGARLISAQNIDYGGIAPVYGRNKVLTFNDCQIRGCYNVFQIVGFDLVDIINCLIWYNYGIEGCIFKSVSKLEISSCEFIRWFDESTGTIYSTGNMIDLSSPSGGVPFGAINVSSSILHPQKTQYGFYYPGSVGDSTNFGTIAANTFVNTGLTTGAVIDIDFSGNGQSYVIEANQGVTNGTSLAQMSLTGNTNFTTISATSTPVKVNGSTLFTFPVTNRVITSNTGEITYNSKISTYFNVQVAAKIEVNSGGNNQIINLYLAANGSVIPFAVGSVELDQNIPLNVSFSTLGFATQGDVFEVYIENTSTTSNILVSDLTLTGFSL